MKDRKADAEALFRDFANRHSLAIEKVDNPNVELLMRLPRQMGLSFELTLGLQNRDELNVGFEGFLVVLLSLRGKARGGEEPSRSNRVGELSPRNTSSVRPRC